ILFPPRAVREPLPTPSEGRTFELAGPSLGGTPVNVADYQGKIVLVDFWATWCIPCVQEMPRVKEVYDKYHDQGLEIIGVSLDDDRAALERFVKGRKIPWPQI